VQLTQSLTDEREADVVVPLATWQTLKIGDTIQVWAYAEKPKWIFWSAMVRYKKLEIWVKINFTLAAIFFLLTMISLNGMRM